VRPIPSPYGRDALNLLSKAQRLLEKAEKIDMVEHEGKKVPSFAADGKGAKDMKAKAKCDCKKGESCRDCEKCPECGEAMNKGSCMKMGCGAKMQKGEDCPECGAKMEKGACMKMGCGAKMQKSFEEGAQPGFTTSFDSKPAGVMFMAESGGQTRNAYYTTNQYPYHAEDVTNKGSSSESVNFETLGQQMNPHHDSVPRQVENGSLTKAAVEALAGANDAVAKAMCEQCGGNQFTGCRFGFGDECPGLEGTTGVGEGASRDRQNPQDYMRNQY